MRVINVPYARKYILYHCMILRGGTINCGVGCVSVDNYIQRRNRQANSHAHSYTGGPLHLSYAVDKYS